MSRRLVMLFAEHLAEVIREWPVLNSRDALKVALKLCDLTSDDLGYAYPGMKRLAEMAEVSRMTLERDVMPELLKSGAVECVGVHRQNGRRGNPPNAHRVRFLDRWLTPENLPWKLPAKLPGKLLSEKGSEQGEPLTTSNHELENPSQFSEIRECGSERPPWEEGTDGEPFAPGDRTRATFSSDRDDLALSRKAEEFLDDLVARDLEQRPPKKPAGEGLRKKKRREFLDLTIACVAVWPKASRVHVRDWVLTQHQKARPSSSLLLGLDTHKSDDPIVAEFHRLCPSSDEPRATTG